MTAEWWVELAVGAVEVSMAVTGLRVRKRAKISYMTLTERRIAAALYITSCAGTGMAVTSGDWFTTVIQGVIAVLCVVTLWTGKQPVVHNS